MLIFDIESNTICNSIILKNNYNLVITLNAMGQHAGICCYMLQRLNMTGLSIFNSFIRNMQNLSNLNIITNNLTNNFIFEQ
jgi:hypothetical protein